MTDSEKRPSLQAEEAFAGFVLQRERGESVDFEEVCRRNPELAADLRRLNRDWSLLETVCTEKLGERSLVATMLIRGAEGAERSPSSEARAVFSDYLLARESGAVPSLDELCAEHPGLASELRELHERWKVFEKAFEETPGGSATLTKTLLIRHGRDALEDAKWEATKSDDHLVERLLSSRGARGHHYSFCGEVARGGMGAILKVWDPNLRRNLAMKVIHAERQVDVREGSSVVDSILSRFLEEAQVTGQLDHPGIVPVYELGVDEQGRCYFTMRLVRGRDLLKIYELVWAEREGWNMTRALNVLLTVCDAMSYAHSKKVLHRDLKPANVMVGRFGETYVMDWGLARVIGKREVRDIRPSAEPEQSIVETDRKGSVHQADELRTMDGDVIGTPAYMAPEQARGTLEEIGTHTDAYSIGAMLYHLLARHAPYLEPGKPMSGMDVWRKVIAGPPKPLDEATPRPPAELVAICEKAMAREVSERYATTTEIAQDLRAFLEGRVVKAYETGPVAEFKKWVKRNRMAAGSILATVGVVLLGLVVSNVSLAENNQTLASDKQEAVEIAEVAVQDKDRAVHEKTLVERQRDEILRLADAKRLEQMLARADDLWPAVPERIPELETWLASAEELAGRLGEHEQQLAALRMGARGRRAEELAADRASHPRADELVRLADRRIALGAVISELEANQPTVQLQNELVEKRAERDALELEYGALSGEIAAFRRWEFDSPKEQWHHDLLAELIGNLEAFTDETDGALASVRDRIALARTIEAESVERYRERWDEAIRSISDAAECPLYGGLLVRPQVGLVPLARNASGLWEFAHVPTGSVPVVASGEWKLGDQDGIVFVLLPGGAARNGAELPDRDKIASDANVTDLAFSDEGPIHEVYLAPFFIGKYEVTQGQWERATGRNPSRYGPIQKESGQSRSLLNPVENVTWFEADRVLWQLGLTLPSEARWEYAARARQGAPWWTGERSNSLNGKANLADEFARTNGGPEGWTYERRLDDGYLVHAAVDALAPNAFGLHHVAGNVSEWCKDGFAAYSAYLPEPLTGERRVPAPDKRAARGGSFRHTADEIRSAYRHKHSPGERQNYLGVRAARELEP